LNNTSPTTTQFTVGTMSNVNGSGNTYVCYSWANSGPYAFGSYEGNNTANNGPMVNIGGSPKFLFAKNQDAAGLWVANTSAIDTYNPVSSELLMDTTAAVGSNADWDFVSNGAKCRVPSPSADQNGAYTYIYGAFGIQPLTDGAINQGRAK